MSSSPSLAKSGSFRRSTDAGRSPDGGRAIDQLLSALLGTAEILRDNRRRIALSVAVALVIGVLVARFRTPVYEAETSLLVRTDKSRVVAIDEPGEGLRRSGDEEGFATEIQFIRSREVGLRVIRDLNLTAHPMFALNPPGSENTGAAGFAPIAALKRAARTVLDGLIGRHRAAGTSAKTGVGSLAGTLDPAEEVALDVYLENVTAEPVKNSRLIRIGFRSPDPVIAAAVANAAARTYVRTELELRSTSNHSAASGLSAQLKALQEGVRESETRLEQFRARTGLTSADAMDRPQLLAAIEDLGRQLLNASLRTEETAQRREQRGRGGDRGALLGVPQGESVVRARQALDDATRTFGQISSQYGSAHPQYQLASAALSSARLAYDQQIKEQSAVLEQAYRAARAAETSLREAYTRAVKKLEISDQHRAEWTTLVQEVETNRQLYQTFLARVKEVQAADDVRAPSADIIDVAFTPTAPIGPPPLFIIGFFGLLGLLTGIGHASLRRRLSAAPGRTDRLARSLGVRPLAWLPSLTRLSARRSGRLVLEQPTHPYSEGIRRIATEVEFGRLDRGIGTLAVTSCVAGEGKETIVSNLAMALSTSHRLLIVDADPAGPSMARALGVRESETGLTELLAGTIRTREAIHRTRVGALFLMAFGDHREGLRSKLTLAALRRLVTRLDAHFDLVLINCPPIETGADALIVSGSCAGTLVVADTRGTDATRIGHALERLRSIDAAVLGLVLSGDAASTADARQAATPPQDPRRKRPPAPVGAPN
ncbi:MAG: polysaccharide biosynthesis tyrosine autokinase [Burkholderiaceae bacterium]